jgi:H+/gluconate symporter-like permease
VLAGALVTYGGVSLFVAFFVLAPRRMRCFVRPGFQNGWCGNDRPRHIDFHRVGAAGTPAIQNAIPMPFFGTTSFAAPGLGTIASAIMLGFGLLARPRRGQGSW